MQVAGILTPIPTPFDAGGDVDPGALRAALARWLATPLAGFVVLGSNGEAALLDEDESDRVIAAAREAVPADRAFIVGTGRESTRGAIQAARRAAALGADQVLVRTPGFYKAQMTAEAFVRHYTAVADASPVPILLYNYTAVTGVTLPVEVVAALARHPNIAGMKESNGDIDRLRRLIAVAPPPFRLLAGSPATLLDAIDAGAAGGILAIASVVPHACVRLFELARAGRMGEARALQARLAPLARLLGSVYGIAGLKAALKLVGCDVGDPRPPLLPLRPSAVSDLVEALGQTWQARGESDAGLEPPSPDMRSGLVLARRGQTSW